MLTGAGFDTDTEVGGLTAFSLLDVGGLLALPLFALPAVLAGAPVSAGLVRTAVLGIAGFVLYAIGGVIILRTERPLAALGRAAQSLWNWIIRGWEPDHSQAPAAGHRPGQAAAGPAGRDQGRAGPANGGGRCW
jgi:hypothetical protein